MLAEQIRDAVANGEIEAGKPLHQEDLAARFGVSRSPIREALRMLESEGVVVYHSNKGAVVAETTPNDIAEMFEIRMALETALVRHAAVVIESIAIAQAKAVLMRVEREEDARAWLALHAQFHETINAAAKRERTAAIVRQNRIPFAHMPLAGAAVGKARKQLEGCDRKLLTALTRRDSEAAVRAVEMHLRHAKASAIELALRKQR